MQQKKSIFRWVCPLKEKWKNYKYFEFSIRHPGGLSNYRKKIKKFRKNEKFEKNDKSYNKTGNWCKISCK